MSVLNPDAVIGICLATVAVIGWFAFLRGVNSYLDG